MTRKNMICSVLCVFFVLFLLITSAACTSSENTGYNDSKTVSYTDEFGRTLEVPADPQRVISTCPTTTTLVYMLAPDRLLGWNNKPDTTNMPEKYAKLPVIGGWFGLWSGNYETMLAANPDLVIYETTYDTTDKSDTTSLEEKQANFGSVPVVGIYDSGNLSVLDDTITKVGNLLGTGEKAEELIKFHDEMEELVKSRIQNISGENRTKVYYAETPSGLSTDTAGTDHARLISLCNGINVANITQQGGQMGQTEVSMEQVLSWNPDVIICNQKNCYDEILNDSVWGQLDAVKNGRVYYNPRGPFCWFDRPPGASTILGIPWTAKVLYPDLFSDVDLESLTRGFYSEFLHYDLSDDELRTLMLGVPYSSGEGGKQ
ncbi:iron complex transport system substrate-binding protein [Methanomicrobium sp. W14]|uniref:ABC transporter substrate-binding protein n=1 Tax=Methanomicrobium sp. W14 TaxID=2817839 RepID=UPI001AE47F2D|nr:ABC transporter substrate-binding protein [Methanomicrobium sp. W14]MBP2134014.1 iron complex transport system substrate-binding protein [Methanomicrobium sp. W14]